ncbi:hypothetical protein FF1_039882 [Malus domestica]
MRRLARNPHRIRRHSRQGRRLLKLPHQWLLPAGSPSLLPRRCRAFPAHAGGEHLFRESSRRRPVSDISCGRQVTALATKAASFYDAFEGSSLLNMYCKAGIVLDARKVFDRMLVRNSVSWATMISRYAVQRVAGEAMAVFGLMRGDVEKKKIMNLF